MTTDLDLDWMGRAECRGATHLMFPPLHAGPTLLDGVYARALAICAACPVTVECRAWAETQPDQWESAAVVAGLTPVERRPVCGGLLGTLGGHSRHRRVPEPPCPACRGAMSAWTREYRDRRKATA